MRITLRRGLVAGAVVGAAALAIPATAVLAEDVDQKSDGCSAVALPNPKGYSGAEATHVSGSGKHVVGKTQDSEGNTVPVIWNGKKAKAIEELKGADTWPEGVTNGGRMIGNQPKGNGSVPWIYAEGEVKQLDVGGKGMSGHVTDINDDGQMVGFVFEETNPDKDTMRAAVWKSPDEPVLLPNSAKKSVSEGLAIDEDGTVVGLQQDDKGENQEFWAWGPDGGKGKKLPHPSQDFADDQPIEMRIQDGHVITRGAPEGDAAAYPAYQWNLDDVDYPKEVKLPYAMDVAADGSMAGVDKDKNPATMTDGGKVELPIVGEPSKKGDDNVATAANKKGDVFVGKGVTKEDGKPHAVATKWTCG